MYTCVYMMYTCTLYECAYQKYIFSLTTGYTGDTKLQQPHFSQPVRCGLIIFPNTEELKEKKAIVLFKIH